jgi:cytochrome c
MDIARRCAGNDGAQIALAGSIANGAAGKWAGYPVMPSGLASPSQATKLSAQILSLAPHSDH